MFLPVVAGHWGAEIVLGGSSPSDIEVGILVVLLASCFGLAVWSMATRRAVAHPWTVAGLMAVAYALHYHLAETIIANAPVIYE